jgi:hypothetical protein
MHFLGYPKEQLRSLQNAETVPKPQFQQFLKGIHKLDAEVLG